MSIDHNVCDGPNNQKAVRVAYISAGMAQKNPNQTKKNSQTTSKPTDQFWNYSVSKKNLDNYYFSSVCEMAMA